MRVDFRYAKEKSQLSGTILRPVAKVILNGKIPNMMYVDSGADITLLPKSVGELIGLLKEPGEKPTSIRGIGKSRIDVLFRVVTMSIGSSRFSSRVAWSLVEDVPLLLGRLDVFTRFNILFREREGIVTFFTERKSRRVSDLEYSAGSMSRFGDAGKALDRLLKDRRMRFM